MNAEADAGSAGSSPSATKAPTTAGAARTVAPPTNKPATSAPAGAPSAPADTGAHRKPKVDDADPWKQ